MFILLWNISFIFISNTSRRKEALLLLFDQVSHLITLEELIMTKYKPHEDYHLVLVMIIIFKVQEQFR